MYYLQSKALNGTWHGCFLSGAETSLPVPLDSVLGPTLCLLGPCRNLEFGQVPIRAQCTYIHVSEIEWKCLNRKRLIFRRKVLGWAGQDWSMSSRPFSLSAPSHLAKGFAPVVASSCCISTPRLHYRQQERNMAVLTYVCQL